MKKKKKKLAEKAALRRNKGKNFFATLILTVIFWGLTAFILYFVDPNTFGAIPVFFLSLFMTLLFAASVLLSNTRRGLLTAMGITSFLVLRFLGIGNIINLLLIAGLVIAVDLYFSKGYR